MNICAFSLKNHGKPKQIQQIAAKMMNIAQKHRKGAQTCAEMCRGRPKMTQVASNVSQEGPSWAHLGPLWPTLEAPLATWCMPLRICTHFYQVFANSCLFLLKIHGKPTKIQQIAPKIMNITQKHTKSG